MADKKQHINWKLEFSWRFWLPFVFLAIAVVLAEDRHPMLAFISGLATVLTAEDSGKYIARKQAEQEPRQ